MTFREFWQPLIEVYPEAEARWIGRFVFEEKYGLSHADLLIGRETSIAASELRELQQRLLTGEPVQYVIGMAPFGDQLFKVTPAVLIPRPETLWLCHAVSNCIKDLPSAHVLDIGTGSGCIAITIALATDGHGQTLPQANISAWDISNEALAVARANAKRLNANVSFEQHDILTPSDDTACWDVIVSNPPYICEQEKKAMEHHVLDFEPSLALFVPDDDPLLYYRAIGNYAVKALRPGGRLFLEINPFYAKALCDMLLAQGFTSVTVSKDDNQKERYVIAS